MGPPMRMSAVKTLAWIMSAKTQQGRPHVLKLVRLDIFSAAVPCGCTSQTLPASRVALRKGHDWL